MGRRRSYREVDGRLLVGRRLGFGDAGVGGEDPIQGHAASIRCARAAGRGGGHGAGAGIAPCPARLVLGIDREDEKVRGKGADRLGPTRK
jgi:uncharacterized spore protein YtfJ